MSALKNFIFHQERDDLHAKVKVFFFNTLPEYNTDIPLPAPQPRQREWSFLACWQWMNKAVLHHHLLCWASPLPLSITAQTTAVSRLSPSSSCKQHSFPQIPALGPAQAAVPDHSSQLNVLFGLSFLKTRSKSGAVSNELSNV